MKIAAALALIVTLAAPAFAVTPPIETEDLATGRYARMHMLLEKTFLGVNVLDVNLHVGPQTSRRLEALARGHEYSPQRAAQIARAVMDAKEALFVLEFRRDVSLDRFLQGVRENLSRALQAGLIDQAAYQTALRRVQRAFAFLEDDGFREGDRLIYRVHPDSLRTVLVSSDGRTLLDRTDRGSLPRRTLLASYFAPGTDFREPLIRSLFG